MKWKSLSRVQLFATPWTVAYQAPPSMEFSRQEYWSGVTFPSPGDLPNSGIKPGYPTLQADALTSEPPGKPKQITCIQITKSSKTKKIYIKLALFPISPKLFSVWLNRRQMEFPICFYMQSVEISHIMLSLENSMTHP